MTEHPFRASMRVALADNDRRIDLQVALGLTPRFAGEVQKAIMHTAMEQLADMAEQAVDFASIMTAFQLAFASAMATDCSNVAYNMEESGDVVSLTDRLAQKVKRSALKAVRASEAQVSGPAA
jgi:hypothetical protein